MKQLKLNCLIYCLNFLSEFCTCVEFFGLLMLLKFNVLEIFICCWTSFYFFGNFLVFSDYFFVYSTRKLCAGPVHFYFKSCVNENFWWQYWLEIKFIKCLDNFSLCWNNSNSGGIKKELFGFSFEICMYVEFFHLVWILCIREMFSFW